MKNLFSKSIYHSKLGKVALLAAMALCGSASPALGQETIAGTFSLHKTARLGDKVPIAVVFAMASRTDENLDGSKLVLALGKTESTMQSMRLGEQKLVVDFDWWSSRDKSLMMARAARPQGVSSSSKATD